MTASDDSPLLFHIPSLNIEVEQTDDASLAPTRCEHTVDIYVGDKLRKLRLCRSAHTGTTQLYLDSRLLYSRDLREDANEADFKFEFDTSGVRLMITHKGSNSVLIKVAKRDSTRYTT